MLRFGVSVLSAASGAQWRAGAQRFEAAGFDVLWVPDHIGLLDPFAALVAAAAGTERLRVGTYVLNVQFWNPLLLARAAATAHLVTDGRLVLGLGAGYTREEFDQAGVPYRPPRDRVARLEATVPALRRLLAGAAVDDPALGLAGAATGLPPAPVPLLVGGNGDRVLRLAGREADEVGLVGVTAGTERAITDLSHWGWDGLADRITHVRAASGGRTPHLDVLVQRAAVTDEPASALADFAADGLAEDRFDSPFLLVGTEDELVAKLGRLREMGIGGITVFAHDAEALAAVIARVRRAP